ncbi:MAG TPA: long-chain fatty acid--CoA ligase [Rhizomicrobium sp.]|nr:long-chain fatty acid--CoA ligase [Rhizomicrobium sp.]
MRITQGLSRAADVRPHHLAVVDGERKKSWTEFRDRVARLAGALQGLGVQRGDRIAVLANNSDRYLECYYAIFWIAAVLVPLNTRLAVAELEYQLADAGVTLFLFGAEFETHVAKLRAKLDFRSVALDGPSPSADKTYEDLMARAAPVPETEGPDNELAAIFYTGGTTGVAKGVMHTHKSLSAMATNLVMSLQVDEDSVALHSAPMFHMADIAVWTMTQVAGTHVITPRFDEDAMFDLIARHSVSHIFTVPTVIDRLARHPRAATANVSSLKMLGYGGAPMPPAVLENARERFRNIAFGQGFGMTEMPAISYLSPKWHRKGANPEKLKSAGAAAYGYQLKVVNEADEELPRGEIGEIVGRGDNLMAGYWNRPEATAEALRGGWMHSQDVGFMDEDGAIYITDRLKDMIVSGGENVYSIEVENVVYRHEAVLECAVVGVPDERWGERVHAIVHPKSGMSVTIDELSAFCRDKIAGYKIPRSLQIHETPLPRSGAGKILKTDLRAPHWAGRDRKI